MHPMSAADELAMIRSRISRLKAREQELREALIAAPDSQRQGRWTRAEVVETVLRVFDHRLLPDAIRSDPLFWRDRVMTQIRCLPVEVQPPASWVPPRRDPGAPGDARSVGM
ncbi:MAG: hypothetical protein H6898_01570 [Rhodobacter sp.]|nr:hypothetical protein [Paracoccaceae bacterium]MCC0075261.1 hypothetical protein [Rhodobacter sp.]